MFKMLKAFFILPCLIVTSIVVAEPQTTVDIGVGYRRDTLQWKLKAVEFDGDDVVLDVTSRLLLKDIDIVILSGKLRSMDCFYYFRADADYGWICHGKSSETATFTLPLELEESLGARVSNKIDDDYVVDVGAVIGYPFFWGCNCYMFSPWIGYSYNAQKVEVKNRNTIAAALDDPDIIPLNPTGRSTLDYHFRWYGPKAGFDVAMALEDCWSLYGEFSWYFATEVKRKRDSDIGVAIMVDGDDVDFFDSYDKTRNGWGFGYEVGTNYFCSCWYVGVKTGYLWLKSDSKKNDDVRLRSWNIQAVLGYVF